MTETKLKSLLGAGLLALCGAAHAEFMTGNQLYSKLTSPGLDQVLGLGYVMGVFDTKRGVDFCPPSEVIAGQVKDIVQGYLERNPQHRQLTGDVLTIVALSSVWSCKQQKGSGV